MYRIINDKRAQLSQELIYKALADIMKDKDFNAITITEVVKKAEVARSTFYRNFDSLRDVLRLATDNVIFDLSRHIKDYYETEEDEKKLFLKPYLRFWDDKSDLIELLIKANYYSILRDALRVMYENLIEKDNLPESAIKDHFNYYLATRVNLSISILIEWIRNDKDIVADELAEIISKQIQESFEHNILV